LREDPLPITVCIGEPDERIHKQKDIQEIHYQELYAKENLVRESARKRMSKRSITRTVCKGEPGERIRKRMFERSSITMN
jgi:hypothetical protein